MRQLCKTRARHIGTLVDFLRCLLIFLRCLADIHGAFASQFLGGDHLRVGVNFKCAILVPTPIGDFKVRLFLTAGVERVLEPLAIAPAASLVDAGLGLFPLKRVLHFGLLLAGHHPVECLRFTRRLFLFLRGEAFLHRGEIPGGHQLPIHLVALVVQAEERL
jgi:hypothetical protein